MYYILDEDGNKITEFRTTLLAAEAFNAPANSFTRCANNIAKIVRGLEPTNRALAVKSLTCVKEQDYIKYEKEIRWLLTKDDILIINKEGRVCGSFKSQQDTVRALSKNKIKSSSNTIFCLNKVDSEAYGYRIATREHYINMIKNDILYYHRPFNNTGSIAVSMYKVEDGSFVQDFKSIREAAKYMGCTPEGIRQAITAQTNLLKSGYFFKYKESEL